MGGWAGSGSAASSTDHEGQLPVRVWVGGWAGGVGGWGAGSGSAAGNTGQHYMPMGVVQLQGVIMANAVC